MKKHIVILAALAMLVSCRKSSEDDMYEKYQPLAGRVYRSSDSLALMVDSSMNESSTFIASDGTVGFDDNGNMDITIAKQSADTLMVFFVTGIDHHAMEVHYWPQRPVKFPWSSISSSSINKARRAYEETGQIFLVWHQGKLVYE
jgi:hypothetical protein